MKTSTFNWLIILQLITILILLAAAVMNMIMVIKLSRPEITEHPKHILYLPAIPIQFIYEYPECANKLINAMNMTSIHVTNTIK